ncbi:FG-GAP-like repeat-containing protein [Streptomyces yaizuensis]|uniref:FG-GAP-like repeat-containing protein n=1 Tax=Streptomyces yaizuensis TaxID=2989713 RepID=A0ABQ5NZV3_9ACTN|nr:FG-GAP-like repeat-containing protein [Streptomyces sp. YSPA8]GLF95894.1 FG-GAP-like repeat-containing protein [Streptomyces sp. YSPA8]
MGRHALVRSATAVAVSFTVALGIAPLAAGSAQGKTVAGEVVVPATTSLVPRTGLLSAGPSGFLRYEEGRGQLWTTYGGVDTVVDASGSEVDGVTSAGAGSDVVARYDGSARVVTLRNMVSGQVSTVPLPDGHAYFSTLGSTVVTTAGHPGTDSVWHLLDLRADGSVSDRTVEGVPSGVHLWSAAGLGDARGQLVRYRKGDEQVTGWLDVEQGRFITVPYDVRAWYSQVAISPTHVVWVYDGTLHVASRQDPAAAVRTVRVGDIAQVLGLVGDTAVVSRYDPALGRHDIGRPVSRVEAVPLDGSAPRTLLARTSRQAVPTPDGGLLVAGGADTNRWGVSLIEAAAGGGVTVRRVADAYPRPTAHRVSQLTLAQGRLTTVERDPVGDWTYLHTRETGVAGSPTAGARTTRGRIALENYAQERPRLIDTGDGRTVISGHGTSTAQQPHLLGATQSLPGTRIDSSRSYQTASAASGRFAALTRPYTSTGAETRIVDLDTGRTVYTTGRTVQAMWGTTAWLRDGNDGVVPVDLLTGKQGVPVWFGRGCLLNDFQAVGRWLLWNCVGGSEGVGVHDTVTGRNLTLVAGRDWEPAQLGDGFVTTSEAGRLKVIDVRGGKPVSRTVGTVEGYDWDVDPYTGVIAQLRSDNTVRLISSGVPVSALTPRDATVAASADVKGGAAQWSPKWWLNKPAASWKLVISNRAGTAVRTLSGGLARGVVAPAWNGKDGSGRLVANGAYTWKLTATPADGQGAALTRTGTVKVTGAAAARRDFVGSDGFGELLTLNGSGGLTYQYGTGKGTFTGKRTGSGWPATVKAVPFGDLSGDRCNDVLVRFASGTLRAYRPACGAAPTPSTAYTSLGTGWNQYDVLTSPGDVSGDGRADLIARRASTGDVYLYKATSTGKLSGRVKIASKWTGYKKILGAGDLNGDGHGDLLVQDRSNELWRYDGTAAGKFKGRVKVFDNWGASYNVTVGTGDITGDGRADLVSRDTSGTLWRHNGNGKGSFGGATKVATGWQGYKGLF